MISALIYLACFAGMMIIFAPFMIMFNSFMKDKYKTLSSENTKAKLNSLDIGSIISFVIFIAIFLIFFMWAENDIVDTHRCDIWCDYCMQYSYSYNGYDGYYGCYDNFIYCSEYLDCSYCRVYLATDVLVRYYYAIMQWLYAMPRIMCILFMTLSMIKTKHKYGIKSTKFIPAIIFFVVSLILTSIFIEVWIAMLIFAVCSIICFVLAIVFYILAIKKQCKIKANNAN